MRQTSRRNGAAHHEPPANAVRIRNACDDIDVVELLPRVQLPTLVLRCRHDNGAPFEQNRLLARSIARAKFVTLESDNHAALAGGPAWAGLISEIAAFLIAAFLAE
jgi:pimeloyl-ACP methyl ester carboxylesterase